MARGSSAADAEEVAQEALERFLLAAQGGKVLGAGPLSDAPGGSPWGYLLRIAINLTVDRYRHQSSEAMASRPLQALSETEHPSDDNVARLFDRYATADLIEAALRVAVENKDAAVTRVIATMLDRIASTGGIPSSRTIGEHLNLSHTAVQKAQQRFRGYLGSLSDS